MFFQCSLAKFGSPSNTSARWWRLWWWEMRNLKTILNLCYKWALFILLSIGTAMTLSTQIPFAIDATKWSVIGTSLVQAKGGSTWRDTWQECGMCRTLPNLWKWQWAIRTLLTAFWISYHGVACVSWWEFEWYWIFLLALMHTFLLVSLLPAIGRHSIVLLLTCQWARVSTTTRC